MSGGFVYIVASARNGTLYIGATSDLIKRAWEHRNGVVPGFTRKYNCKLLVWYEAYDDVQQARLRELQMKKWKRLWKLSTIEAMNPEWKDLYPDADSKGSSGDCLGPCLRRGTASIHSR